MHPVPVPIVRHESRLVAFVSGPLEHQPHQPLGFGTRDQRSAIYQEVEIRNPTRPTA